MSGPPNLVSIPEPPLRRLDIREDIRAPARDQFGATAPGCWRPTVLFRASCGRSLRAGRPSPPRRVRKGKPLSAAWANRGWIDGSTTKGRGWVWMGAASWMSTSAMPSATPLHGDAFLSDSVRASTSGHIGLTTRRRRRRSAKRWLAVVRTRHRWLRRAGWAVAVLVVVPVLGVAVLWRLTSSVAGAGQLVRAHLNAFASPELWSCPSWTGWGRP